MVLEALAYGRHVLWTKRFPFAKEVLSYQQTVDALRALLEQHRKGVLEVQTDAAAFIARQYRRDECIAGVAAIWNACAPDPDQRTYAHANT